ncbi:unnamed protein product [Acanthoscelides obtectus]|uniref:Regulatory protein zeste n=1 Tax=Acanthoscelides obtectus TaxID=200917 RepID=A0A9P0K841_ACAOB|nr:unnamed protein product [Acanthoscelides obtectus]CAK1633506.1 Myb/SANT-like DNA-binding domain-containing protein 3 [Acanthoscelides obtectus]
MASKKGGINRSKNFTAGERSLFVDVILPKFKKVIENKKTDAVTRKEKADAWTALTAEFNSLSAVHHRSETSLKNLWDTLKKNARKARSSHRVESFKTCGGTKDDNSTPSIIDEKVLAVLGPSCVGLENPFDGDSSVSLSGEQWEEVEVVEVQQVPAFFVEEAKPPVNSEGPQPSTTSAGSSSSGGHKWEEYQPKHLIEKGFGFRVEWMKGRHPSTTLHFFI